MPNGKPIIAFIGFGEAGQAIAAGLRGPGVETMAAWDILFPQAAGEKLKRAAEAAGVRCANSAADAVRGVDLIISAVTAASSVERRGGAVGQGASCRRAVRHCRLNALSLPDNCANISRGVPVHADPGGAYRCVL